MNYIRIYSSINKVQKDIAVYKRELFSLLFNFFYIKRKAIWHTVSVLKNFLKEMNQLQNRSCRKLVFGFLTVMNKPLVRCHWFWASRHGSVCFSSKQAPNLSFLSSLFSKPESVGMHYYRNGLSALGSRWVFGLRLHLFLIKGKITTERKTVFHLGLTWTVNLPPLPCFSLKSGECWGNGGRYWSRTSDLMRVMHAL